MWCTCITQARSVRNDIHPIPHARQPRFTLKITHVSVMALLQTEPTHQMRPPNKDLEWRESVDDVFNSFIDAESFKASHIEAQRHQSDDIISVFDSRTPSDGGHIINNEAKLDDLSWLQIPQFGAEHTKACSCQSSVHHESHGRTSSSESDPFDVVAQNQPDSHLSTYQGHSPASPEYSTSPNLMECSLSIATRNNDPALCSRGHHPTSLTGRPQTMATVYTSQALDMGRSVANDPEDSFIEPLHEIADEVLPGVGEFKKPHICDFPVVHNHVKSEPYTEEIEPLSQFATLQRNLRIPHTPISSPIFDDSQSAARTPFQDHSHIGFPKTATAQISEPFNSLITPPQSAEMNSASWAGAFDDHTIAFSPAFASTMDKAELYCLPAASYSMGVPSPSLSQIGLGIDSMQMLSRPSLMIQSEPSPPLTAPIVADPSALSAAALSLMGGFNRLFATPLSASASSVENMRYPPSPLQEISQNQQPSPRSHHQELRQHPTFQRHHQKHHTGGTPIPIRKTGPITGRSSCPNLSASSRPHNRKRSKSSHHPRRKASAEKCISQDGPRSATIDFKNFTPADSQIILTGVAPSGSSKTKARREKEAAEKRRKLSEATKKLFLEAGGDLEMLEKEGLLLIEEGL